MDFDDDNVVKRESSIKCIFFAEFDVRAGPKITVQTPENYINNETFISLNQLLIPKAELCGKQVSVNAFDMKIIGFPILMKNKKYARNEIIFNLCFVCSTSPLLRTLQYEPIVRKLSVYFTHLELECDFISNGANDAKILQVITEIREQLNANRFCSVVVTDATVIKLKVDAIRPEPMEVRDHDVPLFVREDTELDASRLDLTTRRILPYIDGYRYVSKIAREAEVDITLVKSCIQHLIFYEVVVLQPIFHYANTYITTPRIALLFRSNELQEECLEYVWNRETKHLPTFRAVFHLYSEMRDGMTMRNLCERFNPSSSGISVQNLVGFGLIKGLIRLVRKYPVFIGPKPDSTDKSTKEIYDLIDGNHSFDQICCAISQGPKFLNEFLESNPKIVIIYK